MQKEADYQLATILKLFSFTTQLSKDSKLAFQKSASTITSYIAFLAAQKTAKKTINVQEIQAAITEIAIPGLKEALDLFIIEQQNLVKSPKSDQVDENEDKEAVDVDQDDGDGQEDE